MSWRFCDRCSFTEKLAHVMWFHESHNSLHCLSHMCEGTLLNNCSVTVVMQRTHIWHYFILSQLSQSMFSWVWHCCFFILVNKRTVNRNLKSHKWTHTHTVSALWTGTALNTAMKRFCGGRPALTQALNIYWIFEYCRHSFASKWVLLVWVMDNFNLTPVSLYATYSLLSKASHCLRLICVFTSGNPTFLSVSKVWILSVNIVFYTPVTLLSGWSHLRSIV